MNNEKIVENINLEKSIIFGVIFSRIFAIFAMIFLFSCSGLSSKEIGPSIYFSNISSKKIKNIRAYWSGTQLSLPSLVPGDSRSQNFYIRDANDFFGNVRINWTMENGRSKVKEFLIGKIHLPNFANEDYKYVQIYLDEDEAEVITSDIIDLSSKMRRMEKILIKRHNEYINRQHEPGEANHLIKVQPKYNGNKQVPSWLMNAI